MIRKISGMLLMFLLLSTVVSAEKIIVSETMVKSQYGDFLAGFGFGQTLVNVQYTDGTTELVWKHRGLFDTMFISGNDASYTMTAADSVAPFVINMKGITLDGENWHQFDYNAIDLTTNVGAQVATVSTTVYYDFPEMVTLKIPRPSYTPGTYQYRIEERVHMSTGSVASGSKVYVNVIVPGTTTPTPTTPTPTPTSSVIPPPSTQPVMTVVQLVSQIWSWLSGWFLGLSITGATDITLNTGAQTFMIGSTATEVPDSVYSDGSYSEFWGTWMVVDKNQNIIAQKGSWVKLTGSTYTDTALVNFANQGSYIVVSVIVKVPYTYSAGTWSKGTETIVAQDKLGVTVGTGAPPITGPPTTSLSALLGSIWAFLRGIFGW